MPCKCAWQCMDKSQLTRGLRQRTRWSTKLMTEAVPARPLVMLALTVVDCGSPGFCKSMTSSAPQLLTRTGPGGPAGSSGLLIGNSMASSKAPASTPLPLARAAGLFWLREHNYVVAADNIARYTQAARAQWVGGRAARRHQWLLVVKWIGRYL
jgi:hypothetical protein